MEEAMVGESNIGGPSGRKRAGVGNAIADINDGAGCGETGSWAGLRHGRSFMRAIRLVSMVVPLLVVPVLAAAQSRYFTYERGIDRPGHAYRFLKTHNAADCSLACQAANSCRAWTYVKPGAPRRAGTASRCWLKHVVPQPIRNDCCTSGVRKRSASHVDH